MIILLILTIFITLTTANFSAGLENPLSDEFIEYINTVQNSWIAGRNFHPNTSMKYLKKLQGVLSNNTYKLPLKLHEIEDLGDLPEKFDARDKWPKCESLKEIRDQGSCGSCWAIAAVAAMTDRYCIHSEGKQHFHFSTIDLVTCCGLCGLGCNGGSPSRAWSFYESNGIVSGGNYNSSTGCRPYPYRNCNHHQTANNGYPDCADVHEKDENCKNICISKKIDYEKDIHKAKSIYAIQADEIHIKQEIYDNGPVEATFDVYTDFVSYKKGVYKHTAGNMLGGHAVKILGWGVQNEVKYWLVANSWNEYWGDKGLFKILRGENHCNIELDISAGIPLLDVNP